jgi:hypothetical protein
MRMLYTAALSIGILMPIGCEKASSTAPSTNPGRPQDVRKLEIMLSPDHTITQDSTDNIMVTVNRDNFKDEVKFDVRDLPTGVSLITADPTVAADKNSITLQLKATADAKTVKDHPFKLVAKAKDIPEVVKDVKLTVKPK